MCHCKCALLKNMCSDFPADYWKVAKACQSVFIFCHPLKIAVLSKVLLEYFKVTRKNHHFDGAEVKKDGLKKLEVSQSCTI